MLKTAQQLATLKAAILAETDAGFVAARNNGDISTMRLFYNAPASPAFIVWKSSVSATEVGKTFDAASLDAMTAGNADKLNNFRAWNDAVYPSRADHRAFFDGIFSVASGATTKAALNVLWKRAASRAEKLFATGTGTDVAPATLGWEDQLTNDDIRDALAS